MSYREAIIEVLEFPHPGMQFNELLAYLHRRGFFFLNKKTLSRELKRLRDEKLITTAFQFYPNGQVVKVYTHPLNLQLGYNISEHDLKRLQTQRYKRITAKIQLK